MKSHQAKRIINWCLFLIAGLGIVGCQQARQVSQTSQPVIETITSSTKSWNGDNYIYPKGQAKMTLIRMTVPAGFRTPVHFHPQPGVAYVIKGLIECVVTANKTLIVGQGESFATTFGDTAHYCENIGSDESLIIVAYAGVEDQPVTITTD